jgi:thioredoxin-related protein
MRSKARIVKAVIAVAVFLSAASSAEAVYWRYNYNIAMKDAASEKKPVMLYFQTSWCGWCKRMSGDTFMDRDVSELSGSFVCIKVDGDRNPDIARKFRVSGYPTVVFVSHDGVVLGKFPGYRTPEAFHYIMSKALQMTKSSLLNIGKKVVKQEPGARGPGLIDKIKESVKKMKNKPKKITCVIAGKTLELNGIVYDSEAPIAIINGETLSVGDAIDGVEIANIEPATVTLTYEGEEFLLEAPAGR